jgi:hypothetical protein
VSEFFQNLDKSTATNPSDDELLHLFEKHTVEANKEVTGKNLTPNQTGSQHPNTPSQH